MLTLLIETSTEKGVVFLFKDDTLVFEGYLSPGLHNSSELLPMIDKGLKSLGVVPKDLSLIGVGVGPGSYTGLRVGAMAAKTLSFACKVPLVGLCTLSCFAMKGDAPFAAIIDAKIGGVYLKVRGRGAVVCPLESLLPLLGSVRRLATPRKDALESKLTALYPGESWVWKECRPDPRLMYVQAKAAFREGAFTTDGSVELMYMRKTQAELEKEKLN